MDLYKYLELNKISIKKLADSIAYQFAYVRRVVNKRTVPGQKLAKAISKYTKGVVTVDEILNQEVMSLDQERELIRKMREEKCNNAKSA